MPVTAFTIGQSEVGDLPQLGGTPQSLSKPTSDSCAATDAATRTLIPAGANTADTAASGDTTSRTLADARATADTASTNDTLHHVYPASTTDACAAHSDIPGYVTKVGPYTIGQSQVGGRQLLNGQPQSALTQDYCATDDTTARQAALAPLSADTCNAVDSIHVGQFPEPTTDTCLAAAIFGHAGISNDLCAAADTTARAPALLHLTADPMLATDAAHPGGADLTPGTYGFGLYGQGTYGNRFAGGPPYTIGYSQVGGLAQIGGVPFTETLQTADSCASADTLAGQTVTARTTADTAAAADASSISQLKTTTAPCVAVDQAANNTSVGAPTSDDAQAVDEEDDSSPGGVFGRHTNDLALAPDVTSVGVLTICVDDCAAVDTIAVAPLRHAGPFQLSGTSAPQVLLGRDTPEAQGADDELDGHSSPSARTGRCAPRQLVGATSG